MSRQTTVTNYEVVKSNFSSSSSSQRKESTTTTTTTHGDATGPIIITGLGSTSHIYFSNGNVNCGKSEESKTDDRYADRDKETERIPIQPVKIDNCKSQEDQRTNEDSIERQIGQSRKPIKHHIITCMLAVLSVTLLLLMVGSIYLLVDSQRTIGTELPYLSHSTPLVMIDNNDVATGTNETTVWPTSSFSTTAAPNKRVSILSIDVDIKYLADIESITNDTKTVTIKSTFNGDAPLNFFTLYTPPTHPMSVTITGNQYEKAFLNLKGLLVWLRNSTASLSVDGIISLDNCNPPPLTENDLNPSVLQKDVINFPNLKEITVHRINYCFIHQWLRHFHMPSVTSFKVTSCYEEEWEHPTFHKSFLKILNSAKAKAEGEFNC